MGQPKRHHFLPQFYLENFCRDGLLWIRDCRERQQRRQAPKNTAVIGYYYSLEIEGGRDNRVEVMLSGIEGRAKLVIEALISRQPITQEQKDDLALFLGFLWNRVPDFQRSIEKVESFLIKEMAKRMYRTREDAERAVEQYQKETGKRVDITAEELFRFCSEGKFNVGIHRNESIHMMLALSEKSANYFRQMTWGVMHCSEKTSFVTTDNPLILTPPPGHKPGLLLSAYGILTPGCVKIAPLGQSCCLFMLDSGDGALHKEIDRSTVRRVNRALAAQAQRYIISRDEALLTSLAFVGDKAARTRDSRFSVG